MIGSAKVGFWTVDYYGSFPVNGEELLVEKQQFSYWIYIMFNRFDGSSWN